MNLVFNLSLAGYLAALLLALAELFVRPPAVRTRPRSWSVAALALGVVAQTAWLVLRWVSAGRAPFSNLFESLALFAWTLVVVFLVLQRRKQVPALGAATALLAVVVLAAAAALDSGITPLTPALRSRWLAFHVFACFLGYGAVAVAALSGAGWLILHKRASASASAAGAPERMDALESVTDRAISFGFLLLTVGIVAGAVWANSAWGTYWSWDPKETWAFITWLIYAGYLHCRHLRGWRGKPAAWLSVAGFASVIFTYAGVSFLMGGMHSYAR
jgi:cytochrome c-type biogenesis protein CcsB